MGGGSFETPVPQILAGVQYVKTVSFAVHDSPGILGRLPAQPHIALGLDVTAQQLGDHQPNFEVALRMRVQSLMAAPTAETPEPATIYQADILYAGMFTLQNATPETFEPMLLIEAPRLIFPAARNYLADLTREAGLPPTLLQPVDFRALWRQRRAEP
nr:protein-export chaperone SecB [Ameyamaea chiangmaiensis]